MTAELVAHLVGSIPLPDTETVFRTLATKLGRHAPRLPDGETGIRKSWIKFLQDVLAENPAIEVAHDMPPFRFVQWDGKLIREIKRLRVKPGATPDPKTFETNYAEAALASWAVFERLQAEGVIPSGTRFQVSLPTPLAPLFNNMVPAERPKLLPAFTRAMLNEVEKMAAVIPHERMALQWDVCQEVLAWEGYYEAGSEDIREETVNSLVAVGEGVPATIELGYHLCYGSPADEHLVQPRDTGVMVEMTNAAVRGLTRPLAFVHMPAPKPRTDDAYFAPLAGLKLPPGTGLYLGLVHHGDPEGNRTRLEAARRYARVDGIASECGLGRGDPARLDAILTSYLDLIAHAYA